MAVNKVIYGGNTLIDLTGDTVTAADLADGVKATGADGNPIVGLMQKVTIDSSLSATSTNPVQNKVIKAAFDELALPSGMLTPPSSHQSFISKIAADSLTSINDITQMTIEQSADGEAWETVFDSDTVAESIKLAYLNGLGFTPINVTKGYMARVTFATHTNTYFSSLSFYIKSINDTDSTGSKYKCYYGYNTLNENVRVAASLQTWGSWVNTIFKVNGYNIVQYVFNEDKRSDVTLSFFGVLCKGTESYRNVLNFDATKKSTITSFPVKAPNFIGKVNGYTISASVPANAKFTDTVYTHPATHPASMITGLSTVATSGSYNDLSNKPTIPTKVSALQNDAGYLTQHQSLDGYAKTSGANTWTAEQSLNNVNITYERYTASFVSGTSATPTTSAAVYTATGNFTLNLNSITDTLINGQSTVFTAYINANADYALSITNAGTLKYIGSASDVAITSAGMLLNILMTKDASGNLTSIVQASKLS